MTTTEQRNELAKLLGALRMEGRELAPALLDLHEQCCRRQREALERVVQLEAELHALETRDPATGGRFCLHLSPSVGMSPAGKRAIRANGGDWSECRGHSQTRFVHIWNKGPEACELVAQLINAQVAYWKMLVPEKTKRHHCVVIVEGLGRFGSADRVVHMADATAEKVAALIRGANDMGRADLIAEKKAQLEQARKDQ